VPSGCSRKRFGRASKVRGVPIISELSRSSVATIRWRSADSARRSPYSRNMPRRAPSGRHPAGAGEETLTATSELFNAPPVRCRRSHRPICNWPRHMKRRKTGSAAVEELQKLVNPGPQEAEYSYLLGRAWTRLSAWSYQRLARLNPDSGAAGIKRWGRSTRCRGGYELAIAAYQQAARSDPQVAGNSSGPGPALDRIEEIRRGTSGNRPRT